MRLGGDKNSEFSEVCFISLPRKNNKGKKVFFTFYINENHPQVKKLVSERKLIMDKEFIIRYKKADEEKLKGVIRSFNEFNQDLEIKEV